MSDRVFGVLAGGAAQTTSSAPDWSKLLGIPGAVVAAITLLAFVVGWIRPVAIKQARYWTSGDDKQHFTELSCRVKNRKVNTDRTLTNLALIHLPSLKHRIRHWRWRRNWVDENPYILQGDINAAFRKDGVKITKRDERGVRCKILGPNSQPLGRNEQLPKNVVLMAYFGSSKPAAKRPKPNKKSPRLEIEPLALL
jgi:hypothetical protein